MHLRSGGPKHVRADRFDVAVKRRNARDATPNAAALRSIAADDRSVIVLHGAVGRDERSIAAARGPAVALESPDTGDAPSIASALRSFARVGRSAVALRGIVRRDEGLAAGSHPVLFTVRLLRRPIPRLPKGELATPTNDMGGGALRDASSVVALACPSRLAVSNASLRRTVNKTGLPPATPAGKWWPTGQLPSFALGRRADGARTGTLRWLYGEDRSDRATK